jgi:hypothetical protein
VGWMDVLCIIHEDKYNFELMRNIVSLFLHYTIKVRLRSISEMLRWLGKARSPEIRQVHIETVKRHLPSFLGIPHGPVIARCTTGNQSQSDYEYTSEFTYYQVVLENLVTSVLSQLGSKVECLE